MKKHMVIIKNFSLKHKANLLVFHISRSYKINIIIKEQLKERLRQSEKEKFALLAKLQELSTKQNKTYVDK